ncbi:MAG: type IV pilus assembly protein PilM [Fibrobacteria bacterium]|nr:type IV pilus assembly protein PilM [Fibrobacteria bacterium]
MPIKIKDNVIRLMSGDPVSVGLDIGNHSVKIVCIRHRPSGPLLLSAGIHVFKEGTMENGEIQNRNELLNAVISLINKTPTRKIKKVNFSLSWSYGVIADRIRLKSSQIESDEELILMEASRHSPFDVDDIQLDYKILNKNDVTGDMEVLLVAAKVNKMQPFLSLIEDANLEAVNVDVDTFATTNAFLFSANPEDLDKVVCLANIGDNVTNLTFIKHGAYHSTRDVETAGNYFLQTIAKKLDINPMEATSILKGRSQQNFDEELVENCIENSAEELSVGIEMAFKYFKSMENNLSIDKLVLCGGGACIETLPELLAERHDIEVEIADPLSKIDCDKSKFVTAIPKNISTSLMVATGLAIRKF